MAKFTGIPAIPTDGLADWQSQIFNAIKENVELLTGSRGEVGLGSAAVIREHISVSSMSSQEMRQTATSGKTWSGLTGLPAGESVADGPDYVKLRAEFQKLADDVANTRAVVNVLIKQLKR